MRRFFDLIRVHSGSEAGVPGVSLGIKVKIGGRETVCPVSGVCDSFDSLESEVRSINEELEEILDMTKRIFKGPSSEGGFDITPDMTGEEIWKALTEIGDESLFIDAFNSMDEATRKRVADHVLTRCNIFSGKGSVFSALYNNDSGLLDRA